MDEFHEKLPIREGWAEDAGRITAEGDDMPVWPQFENEEDDDLRW